MPVASLQFFYGLQRPLIARYGDNVPDLQLAHDRCQLKQVTSAVTGREILRDYELLLIGPTRPVGEG